MASILSSVTNELQLFHLLLDNPEKILEIKGNHFISTDGKDLFDVLSELYTKGVTFTTSNIVGTGNSVNGNITPELIKTIQDTEYDKDAFEHYRVLLNEAYSQEHIQTNVLKEITSTVTTKGRLNIERMEDLISELQDSVNLAKQVDSEVLMTADAMSLYAQTIKNRIEDNTYYTTGCSKLNELLTTGFAPGEITTIFGSTGVGKSTYSLYLMNRLVNIGVPTLMITLEMSFTATMDRLFASRIRIPMRNLIGRPKEPLDEEIKFMVDNEIRKLLTRPNFGIKDASSLSVADAEKSIMFFKQKTKSKYSVVFIDLATMMQEFGTGEAKDYEKAMNLIHRVAKRTNSHIVLVVQATQKSLEKYKPSSLRGINVFRPSLSTIKNSSAIAERSRTVLSVFRAKYYATRFFPEDPMVEILDDVMEVQVLKQNNGDVGKRVLYIHDEGVFRLFTVPEDYEPKTISVIGEMTADEAVQEI